MSDTTIKKIDASHSSNGKDGQIDLASGKSVSMRLWKDEPVSKESQVSERDYETVGYVIQGRAELHCQGQSVSLGPGDSWFVPKGAKHEYKILEPFTAIEATSTTAAVNEQSASGQCDSGKTQEENHGEQCARPSAGDDDKQANQTEQHEDKAHHDQEVAARIPRQSKNITSNAPEKERKPSEHVDVKEKDKSK